MNDPTHLAISINRPVADVYEYAGSPAHLHEWAAGLAGEPLKYSNGRWTAVSPMGLVFIDFAADNDFGVLDHLVTLPNGEAVMNPVRVVADGDSCCDVTFTVRRRDMSDEQFADDVAAVERDLKALKSNAEAL